MERPKTGSMLCPDCGQLISVNAEVCIHCGRRNPGMWGLTPILRNWFGHIGFTEAVTVFCIALYVLSILLDPAAIMQPRGLFSFLAPSNRSLYALGMTGALAMQDGRWWTLITAIYLHGNLLHIFFNLMWIRQLAPAIDDFFGTARLILIFTIAGVVGFIVSNFVGIPITIGASGSIFGLLGAVVYYGYHRGGEFGTNIFRQTGQWALILFLMGFFMPAVNNWAHGGGFVGGLLAAALLGYSERRRENFTIKLMGLGVIALTITAFGIVVWNLFF
jgi:rhomboid protease GluP